MNVKKAVIYTRVSTDEQIEGTSLLSQKEACLMKAKELGAVVVGHFEDAGVSGAKLHSRPGILQAIGCVERHEAEYLIAAKLDRIGRSASVIFTIAERIDRAGGELVSTDGISFGTSTIGKLMLGLMATLAEFERNLIRDRMRGGRRARAKQGVQVARGRPPYGFYIVQNADVVAQRYGAGSAGTYIIVEEQARTVRELYSRYASGCSLDKLTKWLFESGIPSPLGKPTWSRKVLRGLLMNEIYRGKAVYNRSEWTHTEDSSGRVKTTSRLRAEEEWITWEIPPLIDEQLWMRCSERLAEAHVVHSGKNSEGRYTLSGLLRCPRCGGTMVAHKKQKGWGAGIYFQYYCRRAYRSKTADGVVCLSTMHNGPKLDRLILDALKTVATRTELIVAALEANQKQVRIGDVAADEKLVKMEIARLDDEERATVRAQIDALTKGRDTVAYEDLLNEITRRRKHLQMELTRLSDLILNSLESPADSAHAIADLLNDVNEALDAPEISPGEKRALLTHIIREIRPRVDEESNGLRAYDIHFRDQLISGVTSV